MAIHVNPLKLKIGGCKKVILSLDVGEFEDFITNCEIQYGNFIDDLVDEYWQNVQQKQLDKEEKEIKKMLEVWNCTN